MIMAVFPILILIIIFVLVPFTIRKNAFRLSIPVKLKKYLIIVYCTILIVSTFAIYLIPKNNLINVKKNNREASNLKNPIDFEKLASIGKLNAANGFIKKESWSFDYSGKALKITSSSGNLTLLGERKNIDDGKIEVINYVTDSSFHGINITDKINPSTAVLNKDELKLYAAQNFQIKMNQFNLDFTVNQFLKDTAYQNTEDTSPFFAMIIIYIRIPKNLQIDNTSSPLDMIN